MKQPTTPAVWAPVARNLRDQGVPLMMLGPMALEVTPVYAYPRDPRMAPVDAAND